VSIPEIDKKCSSFNTPTITEQVVDESNQAVPSNVPEIDLENVTSKKVDIDPRRKSSRCSK